MYHSITFGNKNTWTDWHLVPSSRPVVAPPKSKTQYVDIPGADGSIDVTESLAGRPVYSDREGSFDFIVLNDYNIPGYRYNWVEVYAEVMLYLHGKHMRMVLEDDPDYYYEGRFEVDSWTSGEKNSSISISYHLSPYKRRNDWNPFEASDFSQGSYSVTYTPNISFAALDTPNYKIKMNPEEGVFKRCEPGDRFSISGREYHFNILIFEKSGSDYLPSNYIMWGNMPENENNTYVIEDSGYFLVEVYRTSGSTTEMSANEISSIVGKIQFTPGGQL